MWALGLEKKIITTNQMVKKYDFYSSNQILIVNSIHELYSKKEDFLTFLEESGDSNSETRKIIDRFRIDNWVKTVLIQKGYS